MAVHNSRSIQFYRGFIIFVGPWCGNCFVSSLLGLEFCKIFEPHLHDEIDHAGPQQNIDNCNSQAGNQVPVEFRTYYFLT